GIIGKSSSTDALSFVNQGISPRGIFIDHPSIEYSEGTKPFTIGFYSKMSYTGGEECTNCISFGMEFYDASYNEIKGGNSLVDPREFTWSESLDMWIYASTPSTEGLEYSNGWFTTAWNRQCARVGLAKDIVYADIHLMNGYAVEGPDDNTFMNGSCPHGLVDNVFFGVDEENGDPTDMTHNLVRDPHFLSEEGLFEGQPCPWEKSMHHRELEVFRTKDPFVPALYTAIQEVSAQVGAPESPIQVFFSCPKIYFDPGMMDPETYEENIADAFEGFFQDLLSGFNAMNVDPNLLEIGGVYYSGEILSGSDYPFIQEIKTRLPEGWALAGSPFTNPSNCQVFSQYQTSGLLNLFDYVWQQPNAFTKRQASMNFQVVDREIIKLAWEMAKESESGIHIEYDLPIVIDGHSDPYNPYHRTLDYLDYAKKYGFIASYRGHIDDEGAYYEMATSPHPEPESNNTYEELYDLIKLSRIGYVLNGNFEHSVGDQLMHWQYNLGEGVPINSSDFSNDVSSGLDENIGFSSLRPHSVNEIITSSYISVQDGTDYLLKADVINDCESTSLITVEFHNETGFMSEVTLEALVSGINTQEFPFTVPSGTLGIKIRIGAFSPDNCSLTLDNFELALDLNEDTPADQNTKWSEDFPLSIESNSSAFCKDYLQLPGDTFTFQWSSQWISQTAQTEGMHDYNVVLKFYDVGLNQLDIPELPIELLNHHFTESVNTYPHSYPYGIDYYLFPEHFEEGDECPAKGHSFNQLPPLESLDATHSTIQLQESFIPCTMGANGENWVNYCLPGTPSVNNPYEGQATWFTSNSTHHYLRVPLDSPELVDAVYIKVYFEHASTGMELLVHHPFANAMAVPMP
ncbi:MAG: DUF4855 domain-containing protein, partial [Flavobacteriales bacterium]|nr:DUF4855 domain-containing protein [Flavobacteriales bacterium]